MKKHDKNTFATVRYIFRLQKILCYIDILVAFWVVFCLFGFFRDSTRELAMYLLIATVIVTSLFKLLGNAFAARATIRELNAQLIALDQIEDQEHL